MNNTMKTVDGHTAVISSIGTDGRIYGSIPGQLTSTWWHADGRHNLYPNFNLEVSR